MLVKERKKSKNEKAQATYEYLMLFIAIALACVWSFTIASSEESFFGRVKKVFSDFRDNLISQICDDNMRNLPPPE